MINMYTNDSLNIYELLRSERLAPIIKGNRNDGTDRQMGESSNTIKPFMTLTTVQVYAWSYCDVCTG